MEATFFISSTFIIWLFTLSLDWNRIDSWRELGRRLADTIAFTLGRSGGVTVGIRAPGLEIYLGDILETLPLRIGMRYLSYTLRDV